jgi:hypothetical protein
MWKNTVEPGRSSMTIRCMYVACWIPKAKNTNSDCVVLIDFPLQQWFHECPSMLRYTWACLHHTCSYHEHRDVQAAFEGGKWGDRPRPRSWGGPRFRSNVVVMNLSSVPIEIPILWPRVVMVGPRPRVLLTPPLKRCTDTYCYFHQNTSTDV